jgi:hypothetical protein
MKLKTAYAKQLVRREETCSSNSNDGLRMGDAQDLAKEDLQHDTGLTIHITPLK